MNAFKTKMVPFGGIASGQPIKSKVNNLDIVICLRTFYTDNHKRISVLLINKEFVVIRMHLIQQSSRELFRSPSAGAVCRELKYRFPENSETIDKMTGPLTTLEKHVRNSD